MAWSDPFTKKELRYIEEHYSQMTAAEIAEKLGRSRSGIKKKIREMGLTKSASCARVVSPEAIESAEDDGNENDRLSALTTLSNILRNAIAEANPSQLPKLSAEYREVLAEIDALNGGGGGDSVSELLDLAQLRTS